MITSKEVFAKRKEGAIDEAYRMALELINSPDANDWDYKAFCWCLIDIIKRDTRNGDNLNLAHYRQQLECVHIDPLDEVLTKGVRYALSLCNPGSREFNNAKALAKEGRHAEAVAAYREALAANPGDRDVQTDFGWELFKQSKELMAYENVNLNAIKRNLNDYLKLDIEKPSLLHSCVLQLANKLAGHDHFSMLVFCRLWNLNNLRREDFKRYRADDGKEYPSLAEKVIQQAGKEAASSDKAREQEYILSHLDTAIERFPDNIWLKLDKAKVLLALGRHSDALAFGIAVTKAKPNDYWAWDLLGDIVSQSNKNAALGCYCKALSCSANDKFRGKIRLKVARSMLESNDLSAAKHEIENVVHSRQSEGYRIPEEVSEIISQPWFAKTTAASSNREFYKSKIPAAEALLFENLPWIDACIGKKYTVPGREDKPKRKIFLKSSPVPFEISITEFKLGPLRLMSGDSIKVKGEFDHEKRFQVFTIEARESKSNWDIFPELIGIIDHVNPSKGIVHFIVNQKIDGIIPLSELEDNLSEGDSLELRICKYASKHGTAYRVLQAKASNKEPSSEVLKQFCSVVNISNGMGFTENDIFIPPPLITKHQIKDGYLLSGTAVLNFNKKRDTWSWKAISITSLTNLDDFSSYLDELDH